MHSKREYRFHIPRFFRLVVGMILMLCFMVGSRIYGARITQIAAECLRFPGNWLVDVNTGLTLEDKRLPRPTSAFSSAGLKSPDERYIAHLIYEGEQFRTFQNIRIPITNVVIEDTHDKRGAVILNNVSVKSTIWSHNGNWLALEYFTDNQHLLMITDPTGHRIKTHVFASDTFLWGWTPDDAYLRVGTQLIQRHSIEFLSLPDLQLTTTYTVHSKYQYWANEIGPKGRVAVLENNDPSSWLTVVAPNEVVRTIDVPIEGAIDIKLFWSLDGRSLFLHLRRHSSTSIYLLFGIEDKAIRQLARIVTVWETQISQPDPLWLADQGFLVFWQMRQHTNRAELFSLRAQDGHLELLADDVALQSNSPPPLDKIYDAGSQRLALHRRDQDDRSSIELMDLDGKRRIILIEARQGDSISLPQWSSEYVAFTSTTGIAPNVTHRIIWSRIDGSGRGELESVHPFSTGPWFLDGNQWIIFTVSRGSGSSRVGVIDVKSGTQRIFTENALLGGGEWLFAEPDEVSFWWMDDTSTGVDSYRLDGTRTYRFRAAERSSPLVFASQPLYLSPDGQLGAMMMHESGNGLSLQLARRNDQPAQVILSGASFIHPTWSPDGSHLAAVYMSDHSGRSRMVNIYDREGRLIHHFEALRMADPTFPSWITCG
jgi:hypothetical protein